MINEKSTKSEVMEAVKQNGYVLCYASEELRNDRDVVLEAIKQYGYALYYASEALRADREFVLEAVKQNGLALYYARFWLVTNFPCGIIDPAIIPTF